MAPLSTSIDAALRESERRERDAPLGRATLIGLVVSVASALAGAAELVAFPHGNEYVPGTLLDGTAFSSFVVPGLLLGIVVGGSSLVAAILVVRGSRYAVDATGIAGAILLGWIVDEIAILRTLHALHVVFGGLGLALTVAAIRAVLRSGEPRHRWLLVVTAAEAIGFVAPVLAGVGTQVAGVEPSTAAVVIVLAGAVEGLACGTGQALALPVRVSRVRFALLTAAGAAFAWAAAMGLVALGELGVAPGVLAALAAVIGTLALLGMGGAQWLELRRHVRGGARWIGWTALAWILALPMSFLPSPLVDASTPASTQWVLWPSAGLAMAFVMALVTWQGARRLASAHPR